jgi:YD repeat-containing protein
LFRDELGNTRSFSFDSLHRLRRFTTPNGSSFAMDYDASGRLVRWADPTERITRFRYQGGDLRLSALIDPRNMETKFDYDARGNPTTVTPPTGPPTRKSWNTDGTLESWTNRRGQTIHYAYDGAGRLLTKTMDDAVIARFEYDARGNLTLDSNDDASIQYHYDTLGRLARIDDDDGHSLAYEYDAHGRRSARTDQSGFRIEYAYDELGRVKTLTASENGGETTKTNDTIILGLNLEQPQRATSSFSDLLVQTRIVVAATKVITRKHLTSQLRFSTEPFGK